MSYEKFLTFITQERFNKAAPPLHPNHAQTFQNVMKDLKVWRSCVDSQSSHVTNQHFVDKSEGLLTLEELQKIKSSRTYAQAVQLLKRAAVGATLTSAELTLVRDFLVTRFSLDTATCPGLLNNTAIEKYEKAKVKDGCKVMLVARHKRVKDGPAITPMLPELHGLMQTYVNIIRPQFVKARERALFITIDGVAFKDNSIGRRLSSFKEKCRVQLAGRMAFVEMRKKISTKMLNLCSTEERAIFRRVLAYSEKTSRKWYTRPDLTETGAEAVKIIQRLLDPSEKAKYLTSKASNSATADEAPSAPPKTAASAAADQKPCAPPSSEFVGPLVALRSKRNAKGGVAGGLHG